MPTRNIDGIIAPALTCETILARRARRVSSGPSPDDLWFIGPPCSATRIGPQTGEIRQHHPSATAAV